VAQIAASAIGYAMLRSSTDADVRGKDVETFENCHIGSAGIAVIIPAVGAIPGSAYVCAFASRGAADVSIATTDNPFGARPSGACSPGRPGTYTITKAPTAKAAVTCAPGSALLPAGLAVAATAITGTPTNGAGATCAGNGSAVGTACAQHGFFEVPQGNY
jgi:hypothetical protein